MELIQRRFGHTLARAWLVRETALVWVSARNYFPDFRWSIQDSWSSTPIARSHRKRLDITLKGFAQFAEGKPENVFIYLHQTSTDDYTNQRMRRLVVSFGLEKRVLINVLNVNGESLTEQQINLLYNACDVGINTSMGEGWGLISFEHGATGAAQIVPAHTFVH